MTHLLCCHLVAAIWPACGATCQVSSTICGAKFITKSHTPPDNRKRTRRLVIAANATKSNKPESCLSLRTSAALATMRATMGDSESRDGIVAGGGNGGGGNEARSGGVSGRASTSPAGSMHLSEVADASPIPAGSMHLSADGNASCSASSVH